MSFKRLGVTLAFLGLASGFGVSPAIAQSGCTCVVPPGSVGLLSSPQGEVYVSGVLDTVITDTQLSVGSQVATGGNGSANVSFPGCALALGASQQLTISSTEGNLCVRLIDDAVGGGGGLGGAVVAGGVAIGAGALFVALGTEDPVSIN